MPHRRVALIGCGRIAYRHADLLSSGQIKGATLVAVMDTDPKKAEELGIKYNVPHFDDMHDMIQKIKPTLLTLLTPSGTHAKNTCDLAHYGIPIIVEKPMALTLKDADQMIQTCEKHNTLLFIVKQNRFNIPVIKLREALEKGRFGKLILGTVRVRWCRRQAYYDQASWRGTWAEDGGVLANQASHHIDLLEWMMGDVESVVAKSAHALAHIEAEDTAIVLLKFKNGALGIIEATTATRPKDIEGSLSILGERGTVEIGGFAVNEMKTWQFEDTLPEDKDILEKFSVNPPNVYGFGHQAYYQNIIDALDSGQKPMVDGKEGKRSLELICAIYESLETGQEIKVGGPHITQLGRQK